MASMLHLRRSPGPRVVNLSQPELYQLSDHGDDDIGPLEEETTAHSFLRNPLMLSVWLLV